MIVAEEAREFVPFGQEIAVHHPGYHKVTADAVFPLNSFKNISIIPIQQVKEKWLLRKSRASSPSSYVEELYVNQNTVIWSQGAVDGVRSVIKTFTVDSPVIQALWCQFVLSNSGDVKTINSQSAKEEKVEDGVCVVQSTTINVFTTEGEHYIASLLFQILNVWNVKNGLLFERVIANREENSVKRECANQTVVFSMYHPLDEIAPVIHRTGTGASSKCAYMTDPTQEIVYSCLSPPILLIYDTVLGLHSLYLVRSPKSEELYSCTGFGEGNSFCQHSLTPGQFSNQFSQSLSRLTNSFSSQSISLSPLRCMSSRLASPLPLSHTSPVHSAPPQSHFHSPISYMFTPSPKHHASPGNFYRTPGGDSHQVSLIGTESFLNKVEPLSPEVCLDQLWTETVPAVRDGSLGKASKAFFMKDVCGQQFVCYLVTHRQQLRCVRLVESNEAQLIFGFSTVIQAKDAIPVPTLDMLIVLDLYGYIVLYSGTTKINKVHIPGLPMSSTLNVSLNPRPLSSAGQIITSSRPSSANDARFDEEVNMISPVPDVEDLQFESSSIIDDFALTHTGFVSAILHCIDNRFTLELLNGGLCQTSLPVLTASPVIDLCLKAMKYILPRDVAIAFLCKWYLIRNSTATFATKSEWGIFHEHVLSQMGYNTSALYLTSKSAEVEHAATTPKRQRQSPNGGDEDWDYLLTSPYHATCKDFYDRTLGWSTFRSDSSTSHLNNKQCSIDTGAPLFIHIPSIMFVLHLVYEDVKLTTSLYSEIHNLCPLLLQIARDLGLELFIDLYCRDIPSLFINTSGASQISDDQIQSMQSSAYLVNNPPNVYHWLYQNLRGNKQASFPYIPHVTLNIKNIVSMYALLLHNGLDPQVAIDKCLTRVSQSGLRAPSSDVISTAELNGSPAENVVLYMSQLGMTVSDIDTLPVGVSLPLREAIFECRPQPPSDWPEEAYILIAREDLSRLQSRQAAATRRLNHATGAKTKHESEALYDGMVDINQSPFLRMRFATDQRVHDVRRFLQSSKPVKISIVQRPEMSDHDFRDEQEHYLLAVSSRTMALSIGRGMFTLRTHQPILTETLPIPKLCLSGKAVPKNTAVELSHIDRPTNMTAWPEFHNGVAAGLRICSSTNVDKAWILYNKPKAELTNEFGGFLMALGLNKILNLDYISIHDYLAMSHEMTSIGLILGLSAANCGTMNMAVTRLLSIHTPSMLPPTVTDLWMSHNLQVTALLGLGLVYQGTAHGHISEVLLGEIGKSPSSEPENVIDRESYSLAAGLSFGLVMFGKGCSVTGNANLRMADQLCRYMVGDNRKSQESLSLEVTSPAATLALGMFFFNTNNRVVEQWLTYPTTQAMLNHI